MRYVILMGALFLLAGAASALPVAKTPTVIATGIGPLSEQLLLGVLGGHHPDTVTISMSNGVTKVVSWDEFKQDLAYTSLGHLGQAGTDQSVPVVCQKTWLCNSDKGYGVVGSGVFCDNSSAWVLYDAGNTVGGPGSAFTTATDKGPAGITTCFGIFGPTEKWDLTISVIPVATGEISKVDPGTLDGCFATVWTVNPSGYCPNSQSALDTYGNFNAHGAGVKTTLAIGSYTLDYFLGNGAQVDYDNGLGVGV